MNKAARARRLPDSGWINPSRNDLIIEDARSGFDIDAISHRQQCDRKHVVGILKRAYAFGFLTPEEAMALKLLQGEAA